MGIFSQGLSSTYTTRWSSELILCEAEPWFSMKGLRVVQYTSHGSITCRTPKPLYRAIHYMHIKLVKFRFPSVVKRAK